MSINAGQDVEERMPLLRDRSTAAMQAAHTQQAKARGLLASRLVVSEPP
jgi:hypothetical protein